MGQTTDELIELAHQVSPRPQLREMDMLLTVGERISMSLMSMALNDLGCAAISFTGSQAGILTDEAHVNAQIIDVKATRVEEALKENKIVIMAGFQGVSPVTKEITTLGRGGSDTSAVAMAGYLNADRCEILKDVECIFTADPKLVANAGAIAQLNYHQLIEMTSWGAKVLHHRSVEMAQIKNVKLYVGSASKEGGTGTLITSNFQFAHSTAIAVNSFRQVLEIEISGSFKNFVQFLNQNQIAKPQFLYAQGNRHFISGPEELMKSIENFKRGPENYKITNRNVSSVSITFSEHTTDKNLADAKVLLEKNKIQPLTGFSLMNSLHFFVHQEQRNEVIQILHRMISKV